MSSKTTFHKEQPVIDIFRNIGFLIFFQVQGLKFIDFITG
jgi:hypothetical protein